ncbi:MAG: serine hydrolase [Chitinophagaceae bacterium]
MKLILCSFFLLFALQFLNGQTGIPVPQMTQTDNLINNFLTSYGIPGATVAIAKDGKIIYMRGFGYSDIAKTTPTQPYNLFRIASLSKQITSIAIMKLLEQGQLSLSSKVFGPGGILQNHPVFSVANITDTRIYDITVQNLLEHSAGWNRDLDCNPNPSTPYLDFRSGCDPISFPLRVTMLTGTANPVSKDALIKFLLEKGLDFAPGTSYNYSNIGFLVLGDIIEKLSGLPYETYVQNNILAPLGIYDMHLGKNLLSAKQEREGEYVGNGYTTLSCYNDNTYVPWEYGGFSVEAMDAHGGWIASSRDMLKLLTAVDGFSTKADILLPATIATMTTPSANYSYYAKGWQVNTSNNWWHTGSLDGTASEWVRSYNGYTWIIILNKRNITNSNFWNALDNLGWNCISATTSWPTWDLMASPTINSSGVNFTDVGNHSVTVNWSNGNGNSRLVLAKQDNSVDAFPLDGTDYTANNTFGSGNVLGSNTYAVYNGTGNSVTVSGLTPGKTYNFRVIEYNKNATTGNNALYLLGGNALGSQTVSAALPVQLYSFTLSKISAGQTLLNWETTQEVNSDFFDIQRSGDAISFSSIGKVQAQGNTSVKTAYSFTDKTPLSGKNYYRLRQVDKDGALTFSKTLVLDYSRATNGHFGIINNPGKNELTVLQNGDMNFGNAVLLIRNTTGQLLMQKRLANTNTQTVNINALPKAVYFATIFNGSQAYTEKIIIQ